MKKRKHKKKMQEALALMDTPEREIDELVWKEYERRRVKKKAGGTGGGKTQGKRAGGEDGQARAEEKNDEAEDDEDEEEEDESRGDDDDEEGEGGGQRSDEPVQRDEPQGGAEAVSGHAGRAVAGASADGVMGGGGGTGSNHALVSTSGSVNIKTEQPDPASGGGEGGRRISGGSNTGLDDGQQQQRVPPTRAKTAAASGRAGSSSKAAQSVKTLPVAPLPGRTLKSGSTTHGTECDKQGRLEQQGVAKRELTQVVAWPATPVATKRPAPTGGDKQAKRQEVCFKEVRTSRALRKAHMY